MWRKGRLTGVALFRAFSPPPSLALQCVLAACTHVITRVEEGEEKRFACLLACLLPAIVHGKTLSKLTARGRG